MSVIVSTPKQFATMSKNSVVLYIVTILCKISMTVPNPMARRDAISKLAFFLRVYKLINHVKQNTAYIIKCTILSSNPVLSFGTIVRRTKLKTPIVSV